MKMLRHASHTPVRRLKDAICVAVDRRPCWLAGVLFLLFSASCDGSEATNSQPTTQVLSIDVTPASQTLSVGATVQLSAVPKDASGNALSGRAVTWATSSVQTASVSATGLVTGVAPGSASVTATSEGKSGSSAITVIVPPVATVEVSPPTATVQTGATLQLSAVMKDASGNVLTGRTVTWSTSSSQTATINASGLVSGVVAGSVTITATSEGKSGSSAITVTGPQPAPVASVSISPNSVTFLTLGQAVTLTATPRDSNGNVLAGRRVVWSIADSSIVSVNQSGFYSVDVRALTVGTTRVAAAVEGHSASAIVRLPGIAKAILRSISAGRDHACGLASDGTAYCWGQNNYGQLGTSDLVNHPTATVAKASDKFMLITAGEATTCGMKPNNGVSCWGFTPAAFSSPQVVSVSTAGHSCALTAAGQAYCWGRNAYGELGDGTRTTSATPRLVAGGLTFLAIATGGSANATGGGFSCGIAVGGTVYCWGGGGNGRLGTGFLRDELIPAPISGAGTYVSISLGYAHACALTTTRFTYCWGYNAYGQVSAGDLAPRDVCGFNPCSLVPTQVTSSVAFTHLALGDFHSCGLTSSGQGYCWGLDNSGQLGVGGTSTRCSFNEPCRTSPTAIAGVLVFTQLTGGQEYTCGLTTTFEAFCWGNNQNGKLGNDSFSNSSVPVQVLVRY